MTEPPKTEILGVREYSAVIMLPLLIVGIVGNSFSIFVYSRKFMRRNAVGFLLLCLSITDFIVLVTSVPLFSYYKFPYIPGKNVAGSWHSRICAFSVVYIYPIGSCAKMISQYIIIIVSIERWFAVCRPLQVHIWCTIEIALKQLIITILISMCFNFPRFFEYSADLDKGVVNARLGHSQLSKKYFIIFYGFKSVVFDTVLPFIALTVTNFMVIRQLKKSSEQRKTMTTQEQKEAKTTLMLLVMILLYGATHLLNTIIKLANIIFQRYGQHGSHVMLYLHHVSNILLVAYTTATFFIYLIFSIKYRQIICAIFTCRSIEELNSTSNNVHRQSNATTKSLKV
ncbi:unnamed protein product [Caenorhabditis angaria]|uniref:G-protein coupled receptors family 1 profile domain-containing protein n=1 Tax=Caenorhabditis angaria TaxID=860376 RepID=A0A9P1N5T5_9PELO|nr:unnamed protein product [Caenorhabditis angaria]